MNGSCFTAGAERAVAPREMRMDKTSRVHIRIREHGAKFYHQTTFFSNDNRRKGGWHSCSIPTRLTFFENVTQVLSIVEKLTIYRKMVLFMVTFKVWTLLFITMMLHWLILISVAPHRRTFFWYSSYLPFPFCCVLGCGKRTTTYEEIGKAS